MKCTVCGREVDEDQSFCVYCGAPVKQSIVSEEKISQTKICKNCGAILDPEDAFCTQCGLPVSDADAKEPTAKEKGRAKGGKAGRLILVVLGLLVVAFIGCFLADQYGLFDPGAEGPAASEDADEDEPVYGEAKPTERVPEKEAEPEELPPAANTDGIDVEAVVLQIRDRYDKIVSGISSNSYDITVVEEGVTAYSEQDQVKAIIVKEDYDGEEYARNYYYDGDKLFFAYYEGSDSHRFYFNGDQLIRWRYCSDAADSSKAVNYDMESTTSYLQWEERVKNDALDLENKWRDVLNARNHAPQINAANIREADATSYLEESNYNIVHSPERAIDGDLTTGWVEGVSGQGIGESITLYFDGMYLVSGIEIYAGYQKNNDVYNKNSRPKELYVEFSDGSGESYILNDINGVQTVQFTNPVVTDSITLRIDSVYLGSKYEDTVITEIVPY